MTLLAVNKFIEPLENAFAYLGPRGLAPPTRLLEVPRRPYLCVDLMYTELECPCCHANGGVWLEVKEFPGVAFCASHWQVIPSPPKGAFDELLITEKPHDRP